MARILIIEPDDAVRLLLAVQVQAVGHEALVLDGAVAAWPRDDFDVAVIEPAGLLELRFAQGLRAVDATTPIVFVSILEPTRETDSLWPAAHVVKPFRLADLDDALRTAFASRPGTWPARRRLRPHARDWSDETA